MLSFMDYIRYSESEDEEKNMQQFQRIKPQDFLIKGWISKQLEIQANGLAGHLDEMWPDVKGSKWIGGDKEGWERFPYFLDGYIPLSFLLKDENRIKKCHTYIQCLLKNQDAEGRFRPQNDTEPLNEDIWSQFLILKVLTMYAQFVEDLSLIEPIKKGLHFIYHYLSIHTLSNWAAARWFECLIAVKWVLNYSREDWLIRLVHRLKAQGLDYETCIHLWKKPKNEWTYETHVVNIAMALKSDALYQACLKERKSSLAEKMLKALFRYHGTAYGHFTGDECLSGLSPIQGSELCGIVEAMYSYEWLLVLTKESKWGDYLDALAFNGLPSATSGDMWTHQYDQQVNQIACVPLAQPIYRTNGAESNLFGLEPNFGCCTANFGQGWPKYVLSAYLKKKDAIVVNSPIPMEINTEINGKPIIFTCSSEYPFRFHFTLKVNHDVKVILRIPTWVQEFVCDKKYQKRKGWAYIQMNVNEEIHCFYKAQPEIRSTPEGGYALYYGPLLFAHSIKDERIMKEYEKNGVVRKYPYCDYELRPIESWQYAFASKKIQIVECDYDAPFDIENPPLKLRCEVAPVIWNMEKGYDLCSARVPGRKRKGPNQWLDFQPYGATDLRITVLDFVKK